mmetsp:Transcript_90466/g.180019  ORF Transcript_90466/g.180019 Transcript_90466/m.180019 type:complete len:227 (+) Transcript_90466:190-870(+)
MTMSATLIAISLSAFATPTSTFSFAAAIFAWLAACADLTKFATSAMRAVISSFLALLLTTIVPFAGKLWLAIVSRVLSNLALAASTLLDKSPTWWLSSSAWFSRAISAAALASRMRPLLCLSALRAAVAAAVMVTSALAFASTNGPLHWLAWSGGVEASAAAAATREAFTTFDRLRTASCSSMEYVPSNSPKAWPLFNKKLSVSLRARFTAFSWWCSARARPICAA